MSKLFTSFTSVQQTPPIQICFVDDHLVSAGKSYADNELTSSGKSDNLSLEFELLNQGLFLSEAKQVNLTRITEETFNALRVQRNESIKGKAQSRLVICNIDLGDRSIEQVTLDTVIATKIIKESGVSVIDCEVKYRNLIRNKEIAHQ